MAYSILNIFVYGAILQAISKYRGAYPRDRPAESGPDLSQHGMELSIPGTNWTDSDINRGSIGKAKCLFSPLMNHIPDILQ